MGFETARILGSGGRTVLVGARSAELGEKAAAELAGEGAAARFVRIDVTDEASVAAAAELPPSRSPTPRSWPTPRSAWSRPRPGTAPPT
ncbi:SDR family NAD(P)-dependent oxidoreductase [Actinomadura physcomitrii]|uniref:SDR family NAD(P)-dependent oxidoreductase n=1 Tax=Actinomadura physcomitrii TaxID=2650748 RepID=UPI0038B2F28A